MLACQNSSPGSSGMQRPVDVWGQLFGLGYLDAPPPFFSFNKICLIEWQPQTSCMMSETRTGICSERTETFYVTRTGKCNIKSYILYVKEYVNKKGQ